jgi:hypothetical protein
LLLLNSSVLFSALSLEDNKLLDMFPKHQLFYMMGGAYGVLFTVMGLMLMHPTIGLPNTKADPSRWLGWVSYVTIEVKPLFLLYITSSPLLAFLIYVDYNCCLYNCSAVFITLLLPCSAFPCCHIESYPMLLMPNLMRAQIHYTLNP